MEQVIDTGLLDKNGKKLTRKKMSEQTVRGGPVGVRSVWYESVASGLTPTRLAEILRAAKEGDIEAYITLASEMEEREMHYQAELGKRKLAVSRLQVNVEAASDATHHKTHAELIRRVGNKPGFRSMLSDVLDALDKSFSVVEIVWDTTCKFWVPGRYEWLDQRWFQYHHADLRTLRIRDESDMINGLPLPPNKMIYHTPKLKSGNPIRGGLAFVAAWSYMCKSYTVKDWLAFVEVFGMPLRLGRYDGNATNEDINVLKSAVANIGSDFAAVFPASMQIEFPEVQKTGSVNVFDTIAKYFDDQVSIGILGQTATTQGTSGALGNESARSDVRDDIRDHDAEMLTDTLNISLVKYIIDLNFGPQDEYPRITLHTEEPEDLKVFTESITPLIDRGLEVDAKEVRDKFGLSDPKPGSTLLRPEGWSTAAVPSGAVEVNHRQCGCVELNQTQKLTPDQAALDQLIDKLQEQSGVVMEDAVDMIMEAVEASTSFDDLTTRLLGLWPELPVADLTESLSAGIVNAGLFGRSVVEDESE